MKNDMEMVVKTFPKNVDYINIYPVGDVHFGSAEFDKNAWNRWKNEVMKDENGYIVYIGDLLDNGLKNSKTNTYEEVLTPIQQIEAIEKEFDEFMAKKIICGIQGNHEYRSNLQTGVCPLHCVMKSFGLEDLYRQNGAFIKVSLGTRTKIRQFSYTLVLNHGASRGKKDKFAQIIDGMDILISGHTHIGTCDFPSKIEIDSRKNTVRQVGYCTLVVPSFLRYGGYAFKNMYVPSSNEKFPMVRLSGLEKNYQVIWR